MEKKRKNILIISIISLLILVIILYFIINNIQINKILSAKYDDIKCVDSNCNGIIASKNGKNKENVLQVRRTPGRNVNFRPILL